jgi:hypothetical protein
MIERLEKLDGATYKITVSTLEETIKLYVTVNSQDGKPFEIFVNSSSPAFAEHMSVLAVFSSHMLRDGQGLGVIARYLGEIHSAFTGHMKTGGYCPSIYARIGEILLEHEKSLAA